MNTSVDVTIHQEYHTFAAQLRFDSMADYLEFMRAISKGKGLGGHPVEIEATIYGCVDPVQTEAPLDALPEVE